MSLYRKKVESEFNWIRHWGEFSPPRFEEALIGHWGRSCGAYSQWISEFSFQFKFCLAWRQGRTQMACHGGFPAPSSVLCLWLGKPNTWTTQISYTLNVFHRFGSRNTVSLCLATWKGGLRKEKNQRLARIEEWSPVLWSSAPTLCPCSLWKQKTKLSLLCASSAAPGPLGRMPHRPLLGRYLYKILLGEALLSSWEQTGWNFLIYLSAVSNLTCRLVPECQKLGVHCSNIILGKWRKGVETLCNLCKCHTLFI